MKERQEARRAARLRFEFFRILCHLMAMVLIGIAAIPAVGLEYFSWKALGGVHVWFRVSAFAFLIGPAYFVFGICLMLTACAIKNILGLRIRPGLYRLYEDSEVIRWMCTNSLILVVNACFTDALRVSPLQNFFYRAMGAKIGSGAEVNTSGLADLNLVEIGPGAMLGGGTTLICHAVERGMLKLAPVYVGAGASVGIDSIVMPGCRIGDGAVIAPRSMLPAGTQIPAKGHYGGDPLRDLRAERRAKRGETEDA